MSPFPRNCKKQKTHLELPGDLVRLWLGLHLTLEVDVVPLLDEEVLLAAAAAAEGAQGRANLQGDAREVCKLVFLREYEMIRYFYLRRSQQVIEL